MQYLEYKPHPILEKYIECYWSACSSKPPFRAQESLIPDGTIELMFNFGDNYAHIKEDQKIEVKGSHIIGIRKKSLVISQTSKQDLFCVRFKLGGTFPFFGIPAHLFAAGFYSLEDLLGKDLKLLEEQLYETRNNLQRVTLVDQFLMKKLKENIYEYRFIEYCIPELLHSSNVNSVIKNFNTSYKTLERRFSQILGISPSEFLKISRFNKSILAMYSCSHPSFTSIAHVCGYYDQSHFIREFKQLTGYAPREFLKEQFTIVQVIQPALADRMSKSYNF